MTIHVFFKNKNAAAAGLWKKPVRGKRGKTKAGFTRFPPPVEIPHIAFGKAWKRKNYDELAKPLIVDQRVNQW